MGVLTDDMKRVVSEQKLGFVATVAADGTPNLSPKGTTSVWDDDHLAFADIASPGTVENLRSNPVVEINVVDPVVRKGYRFKGTATVHRGDEVHDRFRARFAAEETDVPPERVNAVVVVKVERARPLVSPAYEAGVDEATLRARWQRHFAKLWAEHVGEGTAWPPEVYEAHYLADDDAYRGSGHSGDAASWEAVRRPIVRAIDRPGAFLDVGCANGLLLESLVRWSPQPLEPYGLDFAPRLVEDARRRLPRWAERFFVGDVLRWEPPRRFDYVRTELGYAPDERRRELVERLLDRFLAPGGRLIVCGYGGDRVLQLIRDWGYEPELELEWRSPRSGRLCELVAIGAAATP